MFDKEITRVQMWNDYTMMGVIPKTEAEEMVRKGGWKIINGVAITPM